MIIIKVFTGTVIFKTANTDLLYILFKYSKLQTLFKSHFLYSPKLVEVLLCGLEIVQELGDLGNSRLEISIAGYHILSATRPWRMIK